LYINVNGHLFYHKEETYTIYYTPPILACIVYWQAKEIGRVISECNPEIEGIDISLLEHVSPIEWDNVLLYGEYVLDPGLIK